MHSDGCVTAIGVWRFSVGSEPIPATALRGCLDHPQAGAVVVFEGMVRDVHCGRAVSKLYYETADDLVRSCGATILAEARRRWPLLSALGHHRNGTLGIGESAVWIGVASAHRADAFAAASWLMDAVKSGLPVWKRDHWADGSRSWSHGLPLSVGCELSPFAKGFT